MRKSWVNREYFFPCIFACLLCILSTGFSSYPDPCVESSPFCDSLLVGRPYPPFETRAIVKDEIIEDFNLENFRGQYIILLFYPLDFTFVCPTELLAFQDKLEEFKKRNAEIFACSVDSVFTHRAWLNTPRSAGGIQGVEYPLLSDLSKSISRSFHVLDEKEAIAYRGIYLIDRMGIIRHQLINDLPLGRSVDEILRVLDALITHDTKGCLCPANWKSGEKTMEPTREGLMDYFHAD